ncbi:putative oxidoreductase [Methanobrevibacter arboriphilus JCM 13429 = DSM 1125]|uniref:Putative oxidoreductase n=1 Tax=Methanobrevibacter arboriphilus JCM 13429 = DSM 1125 TaxID=1300164 RepID=A0A1V6N1Z5_METAZ|nr:radical SAM protein [Methanobrevibacter arboriphilus]OQD58685.1 putative oxidoreductase [Methanobrevibacter arboriphilus JCM 13429 = DSM 1125]
MNSTDVLLINPIDNTAVKNGLGLSIPPLNLMYLAGALEKASFSVKIFDDDLYQLGNDKILKVVSKIDPMVVGLTATTATINNALEYVKNIKRVLPNVLSVIGGPHTTFVPEETLIDEESLDVVVIGEGEETFVDLVEAFIKTQYKKLSKVKGIAFRDEDKVRMNGFRPLIKDLDSIPFPARHLVPFKSYELSGQSGGMITSRGCVFGCNYCSSSLIMGKKFRTRSPENVVDEVEELVFKYGLEDIAFLDDIFMLDKRRAIKICDEIKERGIDLKFVASSRVDTVNKSLLESLTNSGMKTLYYGVESGSQRVLDLMGKNITLNQTEKAFKIAKDVGVDVIGSFILGYPGETVEEMNDTIDFSIKLDPDYAQYSILTPFPGTPIYSQLKKSNLLEGNNWDNYTVLNSVLNYEKLGLSSKLIERKLIKAYLKFYVRPSYIFKHKYMLKVLADTVIRSFVLPKFKNKNPQGWYDTL